jgi:anaerobic magnesium-protoporphyrin IX monomethyl ester cyclase
MTGKGRGVDVVILKPGSQKRIYGDLSDFTLTGIEPPLWSALLAAWLREKGYSVALLDAEVEEWSHDEAAEKVRDLAPLLAVISVSGTNPSASTMNMTGAGEIVRRLKELAPGTRVLFHGLHPSALPERTMREEEADFVCEGEGFHTLPALLDALKAGGDGLSRVPGLWYREEGGIRSTPRAPLFADLDLLPLPAWDLLPMARYRAHNWHCFDGIGRRQPYGVVYTNLGCPYNCTFCCINAIFGKSGIRYLSPSRVIGQIDLLVQKWGVRNIKIMDELFALREDRVVEICDLIIERGYDLNIWAYARVNTVTPRMLAKMKRAGIHWVAYGFESGSRRVLAGVNKRYDPDSVMGVVKATFDEGLYIGANFIFGLPDDDFDSMQETLAMAMEINAEWFNIYATMAYPGSALYAEALEKGWPLPANWQAYSQYSWDSTPLPTRHLTAGQVLAFRDYAFHAYFGNPRYLDKIDRLFGRATVEHVRDMAAHRLKRKFGQFGEEPR